MVNFDAQRSCSLMLVRREKPRIATHLPPYCHTGWTGSRRDSGQSRRGTLVDNEANNVLAVGIAGLPWLSIQGTQIALFTAVGLRDAVAAVWRLFAIVCATVASKASVAILLAQVTFLRRTLGDAVATIWSPLALRRASIVSAVIVGADAAGRHGDRSISAIALLASRHNTIATGGLAR